MQKLYDFIWIVCLCLLECEDLCFVYYLNNNVMVMCYWFEEFYEIFVEFLVLFEVYIYEQNECCFIVDVDGDSSGLVELVEINIVYCSVEFQIIIVFVFQGCGLVVEVMWLVLDYGFLVLNLYKIYFIVDCENEKVVYVYVKVGFWQEGVLKEEFFMNGQYCDVICMGIFQCDYLVCMQVELVQEYVVFVIVEMVVY